MIRVFALSLFALALLAVPATAKDEKPVKGRVFELRIYTANEGKMEALHKRFRDHTCALFKKHGMELVGFWVPQDPKAKDKLYYILAFPSKEAGVASWKAFRDDPEWQRASKESHKDGPLVGKVESIYMDAMDYSPMK
jgi:hypothetical protein